jgi:phospholipid-binding lipoprotein MlaA
MGRCRFRKISRTALEARRTLGTWLLALVLAACVWPAAGAGASETDPGDQAPPVVRGGASEEPPPVSLEPVPSAAANNTDSNDYDNDYDNYDDNYDDSYADFDDFDDFDLDFELKDSEIADPLEPINRATLYFNRQLDRFILDPLTIGYRYVVPGAGRRSVNRFFTNVNSTQSLINDMFQLEWGDAGRTLARLLINSTAGIGGLLDPATAWGLPGHVSDFGQTLTLAGVSTGPYLVLPLFGPSDARDAVGLGVDSLFHPTFFFLPGVDALFFNTSSGFSQRESHYEELKALEESSIDYYSALRSGFIQNRDAQIWARRENRRPQDSSGAAK